MQKRNVVGRVVLSGLCVAGLVGASMVSTGCLAAAAGVGTAYAVGEDTMYSDLTVEQTVEAVKLALADSGATLKGVEQKDTGKMVRASMMVGDDAEDVHVGVWNKGPGNPTKIEVRIGTFSQNEAQHEMMGHIRKRLDAMAAG